MSTLYLIFFVPNLFALDDRQHFNWTLIMYGTKECPYRKITVDRINESYCQQESKPEVPILPVVNNSYPSVRHAPDQGPPRLLSRPPTPLRASNAHHRIESPKTNEMSQTIDDSPRSGKNILVAFSLCLVPCATCLSL